MTRPVLAYVLLFVLLTVSGCTSIRESQPARTATEELLISTASDRAAAKLVSEFPTRAKVFVDASDFEGTDSKYAIGAIREAALKAGDTLAPDAKSAQAIVEIRAGALSIDQKSMLIGIPQFNIPIPFSATPFTFPEIPIYKSDEQKGVAKFAAASYSAKTRALIAPSDKAAKGPQFGFAQRTKKELLFFSWTDNDIYPGAGNSIVQSEHEIWSGGQ